MIISRSQALSFSVISLVFFLSFSSLAQVPVIDVQLNATMAEKNRLVNELLTETESVTTYINRLMNTVGDPDLAVPDSLLFTGIKYPKDLITPQVVYKMGLTDINPTFLTTPLAIEAVLSEDILVDPVKQKTLSLSEYNKVRNRQLILGRRAVIEGYSIAYAARMKAAGTGEFLKQLRTSSANSTSIRNDLAIENAAMAEIVGQLGTLTAAAASELEITAANALLGLSF